MHLRKALSVLSLICCPLAAESVSTSPLGFNKVTCLVNSDTIVGVPFRQPGGQFSALASAPVINGDAATLTLTSTNLVDGSLGVRNGYPTHYIKFNDGTAKEGSFYTISGNTTNSVTINLNGDNLTGATTGNSLIIAKYWTLDSLFPPANATSTWTETPTGSGNWIPDGHAVVKSGTASLTQRKTEVLLPETTGTGTNRLSTELYYITGGIWRKPGIAGSFGSVVIYPDSFITIRHRPLVNNDTVFRSIGDVEASRITLPLATNVSGKRDAYIGIPRPVDVRLADLNLIASGAFVASDSTSLTKRRDELLVYDNSVAHLNKIPVASYYFTAGNWRVTGSVAFQNDVVIPAGAGFTIRKYPTIDGSTAYWLNLPNY